jgi:predicted transcriptional regulator
MIPRGVDILREMSTESVNLSRIAKRYGVSRQYIHKLVQKLVELGLVVKTGRGQYALTEKGRAYLENAPKIKMENFDTTIRLLRRGAEYFLSDEAMEKNPDIGIYFVQFALATFLTFSLSAMTEASFKMADYRIDAALDKLWRDRLRWIASALAAMMIRCGNREWEFVKAFFENYKRQAMAFIKVLDEYYGSSR